MRNFLQNFNQLSFWLGFIAASLFWWLYFRFRPYLKRAREQVTTKAQTSRQQRRLSDEVRLANDTLRRAQGWHIAASLFSLDEVLIPPRLLLPPLPPDKEHEITATEVTDWAIPYLPDWPLFASHYGAASMTPVQALQGNANLAIIGEPGSGKTVTLAHLATEVISRQDNLGAISGFSPILLHLADLPLANAREDAPLAPLIAAVTNYAQSIKSSRVPALLNTLLENKTALLLLDGLDELSPVQIEQATNYIGLLLRHYPETRIVITAAPNFLDNLTKMGFIPTPLASWNQNLRSDFLQRWGQLWNKFVKPLHPSGDKAANTSASIDPLLLHGWLLNNTANLTPLEITTKAWATYAGDLLGPTSLHALEAYIRRMIVNQPPSTRPALQMLAFKMVLSLQPLASVASVETWLGGGKTTEKQEVTEEKQSDRAHLSGALTTLVNSGLIQHHHSDQIRFVNPIITGYLASQALLQSDGAAQILGQPDWNIRDITLKFLAVQDLQATWVIDYIEDETVDPILRKLLGAASWLRDAPEKSAWASELLRNLAATMQKDTIASNIKSRIISALVQSNHAGIAVLLRQLLSASQNDLRQYAALGTGILRDSKSTKDLAIMAEDPIPQISRAALLALTSIGEKSALEVVGYALLHGDESLQQAAAEALANHMEEGHPSLEEGSSLENAAVRRAVVYGLARIRRPWAIRILEKLRTEDDQWIVQDAASQRLEAIKQPDPRLPNRLPALTLTPWLIQYAGEHGIGVAPGKPAFELVLKALREGNDEQKLCALHYLKYYGDDSAVMTIYQTFYSERGEIREAAFDVLWHLAAYDIELPPPIQFGLK